MRLADDFLWGETVSSLLIVTTCANFNNKFSIGGRDNSPEPNNCYSIPDMPVDDALARIWNVYWHDKGLSTSCTFHQIPKREQSVS